VILNPAPDFNASFKAHNTNYSKRVKLEEELLHMHDLVVKRIPAFNESSVRVTKNSTITLGNKIYSAPPRLIG